MFDFGNMFAWLYATLLVSVPLGLWKLVDIVIWIINHVSVEIK